MTTWLRLAPSPFQVLNWLPLSREKVLRRLLYITHTPARREEYFCCYSPWIVFLFATCVAEQFLLHHSSIELNRIDQDRINDMCRYEQHVPQLTGPFTLCFCPARCQTCCTTVLSTPIALFFSSLFSSLLRLDTRISFSGKLAICNRSSRTFFCTF